MILIKKKMQFASFFLYIHQVCHFDEGEISTRSSTKIRHSLRSYLRRFASPVRYRSGFLRRNDKYCGKIGRKENLFINFFYFQCNSKAKHVFSPFVMLNVAVV